jgi:hypothetical protein
MIIQTETTTVTVTPDERWKNHPFLIDGNAAFPEFPSGTKVRLKRELEHYELPVGTPTTIYFIKTPRDGDIVLRLALLDGHPDFAVELDEPRVNGWSSLNIYDYMEIIELPENPVFVLPPFRWATKELGDLVAQHPRAEVTRGLIRKVYNAVPPADCTDGEKLAAWARETGLKTFTPAPTRVPPAAAARHAVETGADPTVRINIMQEGSEDIIERSTRYWRVDTHVDIPASVILDGEDSVQDWVDDWLSDNRWEYINYGDTDYGDSETTDTDYESSTFTDYDELLEEAEALTATDED